jgi:hypothetical protein
MERYRIQDGGVTVADASLTDRLSFIRWTYAHLLGAVVSFVALEALLVTSETGVRLAMTMMRSRAGWLLVLGLFMIVGFVAERWARSARSSTMQYIGLLLYVVAESILFLPLLVIARFKAPEAIPTAALITGIIFSGLTAVVFLTRKDFSWLRNVLMVASFAALGVIVASLLFGFTLGVLFSGLMVAVAAGYVLYHTSNVLHHYPVGGHVGAALSLFASIALLFWYVLRILMSRR